MSKGELIRKVVGWTLLVPGFAAYLYGLGFGIWTLYKQLLDLTWSSTLTVFLVGVLAAFIGFACLSWDDLGS